MKSFVLGCVFTLVCAVAFGWLFLKLGIYPVNADTEPHWLEKKITKIAVNSYVAAQSKDLKNPLTLSPEVLMDGMKSFKSNCAGCHGSPVHLDDTFAKSMFPKAPQFGHKGLDDESNEIFWITKHGIRMSGMPGFGSMLSDEEIWKLAIFINNIEKLPPAVQAQWQSPS